MGVIDGGGVAVDRGRIVEAASSPQLERRYSARTRIQAEDEIILPGFVDSHTHLVFQGSREDEFRLRLLGANYLDILKQGGGIMETVNRTRETGQVELLSFAQRRLNIALELGTTTLEIKSGYGLTLYDELKLLRVIRLLRKRNPNRISSTFLGAHAVPPGMTEQEYSTIIIDEVLPAIRRENLAEFCDVFCEKGVFTAKSSRRILRAGTRMGLRPKIHADQITNSGGARVANEVQAISADHLVHSSTLELERMKRTSVIPVILPASSHSLLNKDFAPAKELLSMGLPVALGSDFSPSNWILGLLTVAAIASRQLRMEAAEIIRAITLNAARALGLHHRIGSLSPGKSADMVLLRAPSYKWIGYTYGEKMVDKVLIGGKECVIDGKRVS